MLHLPEESSTMLHTLTTQIGANANSREAPIVVLAHLECFRGVRISVDSTQPIHSITWKQIFSLSWGKSLGKISRLKKCISMSPNNSFHPFEFRYNSNVTEEKSQKNYTRILQSLQKTTLHCRSKREGKKKNALHPLLGHYIIGWGKNTAVKSSKPWLKIRLPYPPFQFQIKCTPTSFALWKRLNLEHARASWVYLHKHQSFLDCSFGLLSTKMHPNLSVTWLSHAYASSILYKQLEMAIPMPSQNLNRTTL